MFISKEDRELIMKCAFCYSEVTGRWEIDWFLIQRMKGFDPVEPRCLFYICRTCKQDLDNDYNQIKANYLMDLMEEFLPNTK